MSGRKVVANRVPFFQIGGEWFADLLWSYGSPLAVYPRRLSRFLAMAPPSTFVVGRRLEARQGGEHLDRREPVFSYGLVPGGERRRPEQ